MNRYVVWSTILVNDEPVQQKEVTRSDEKVARLDAELITWVGHRRAWVQDTEEGK